MFTLDSLLIAGPTSVLLRFTLNTDALSPVDFKSVIPGVTQSSLTTGNGYADLTLNVPDTLRLGVQTAIGFLRCCAMIADSTGTVVTAEGTQMHSSDKRCVLFSTREAAAKVHINPLCGVATITQFMQSGRLPTDIIEVRPNPATSEVTVRFRNEFHSPIHYDLSNALGITQRLGTVPDNELVLDLTHVPPGVYYFRATGARDGMSATRKILVTK